MFPVLRVSAHMRHAALNYATWWWNPPMLMISRIAHINMVNGFYDALEEFVDKEYDDGGRAERDEG